MAAPVDAARVATNISTAATSHAINVGSPAAGTLLILLIRFGAAPGTVTFTGYTQLVADTSDASDDDTRVYYRWADGAEGATDTLTTVNSVKLGAICWGITGAEHPSTAVPTISTVAVGTTTANTANPGSVAPTGAPVDTLYLAMMGLDGSARTPTAGPASYSNFIASQTTGGATATQSALGGASRQLTASSSDDPGTFTHPAALAAWTAFTVAIPAPSGGGSALTLDLSDSVTTSDSLSPSLGMALGLSDSVALADSPDLSLGLSLSLADTVALADNFDGVVGNELLESYYDAGAIVGTFIVGDGTLVGESPVVHYATPVLTLQGKAFVVNVILDDFEIVTPLKPTLVLQGKQFVVTSSYVVSVGKPALVLKGKPYSVPIPVQVIIGKPALLLRGKGFSLQVNSSLSVGKPVLYLRGKFLSAAVPGLIPSTPLSLDLVPTTPASVTLVPAVEESRDLVPTVEEFR